MSALHSNVIDKNAPHQLCRNGEEMEAVIPMHRSMPNQTKIRFMHESCALQCCVPAVRQNISRHAAEFVVDERNVLLAGCAIAIAPLLEELCNLVG